MHILFAGGGTAGHVNPALAIAGFIKEMEPETKISYIGTPNNIESRLVPAAGYDFYTIDVTGFRRKLTPGNVIYNINAVKKAFTASVRAKKIINELKPDIVVGTGGYVSGPVLKAAVKLGIKTAIHEQNAFPGLTTKALAPDVDRVMLAMPEALKYLKINSEPYIVGNPVRQELIKTNREEARAMLGLDSRPLILSFGGSLGARPINEAVVGLIRNHNCSGKYYHIHATGKSGYASTVELIDKKCGKLSEEITVKEYINDMNICMAAADLVICRAGAITLSELCVCGKAAILIPSPYVAENHQFHNAMALKNKGAALVIEEKDLTEQMLITTVNNLLGDFGNIKKMSQNAKTIGVADSNERVYKILSELYSQK